MYRATPITQRDGSSLANANCRMAAVSTGIDFHSKGAITSTGGEMRSRQSDQSGGTDSGDAAQAWETYGQELLVRDGQTFADLLDDLREGRCVQIDVWHASSEGPCVSGSGAYGHSMAVAPESNGSRWLTSDPWCSPGAWEWWEESLLRAGAEHLGSMAYTQATGGRFGPRNERELLERMRIARYALFTLYRPDRPASQDPPATGGGGRIFFTATRPQGTSSVEEGELPINAAPHLVTDQRADAAKGVEFFADANLSRRLGSMSKDAVVTVVGAPIGESVEGGSRAILVNTASAYNDGTVRPTIVYVSAGAIDPYTVPQTPPTSPDIEEALALRDSDWREWLLQGSPGDS